MENTHGLDIKKKKKTLMKQKTLIHHIDHIDKQTYK